MGYRGILKNLFYSGNSSVAMFELTGVPTALKEYIDQDVEIEIKPYKSSRSKEQNALLWQLIHEIDRKENGRQLDEMSIYRNLIKRARIRTEYLMMTEEAYEELERKSLFRCLEKIEERVSDKGSAWVVRCYYGSSKFNTKEMHDFIETTLDYAERIGIDTLKYSDLKYVRGRNERKKQCGNQ